MDTAIGLTALATNVPALLASPVGRYYGAALAGTALAATPVFAAVGLRNRRRYQKDVKRQI